MKNKRGKIKSSITQFDFRCWLMNSCFLSRSNSFNVNTNKKGTASSSRWSYRGLGGGDSNGTFVISRSTTETTLFESILLYRSYDEYGWRVRTLQISDQMVLSWMPHSTRHDVGCCFAECQAFINFPLLLCACTVARRHRSRPSLFTHQSLNGTDLGIKTIWSLVVPFCSCCCLPYPLLSLSLNCQ